MKEKIWKVLTQILYYHNESVNIIKPFFENLNNENINNNKHILKLFYKEQIKVLYENGIITEENFKSIILNEYEEMHFESESISDNNNNNNIEDIISGDKIKELQELIQVKDIKAFNIITKPFNEVKEMKIPLIQYCIMKNAIQCFKYLLVNGFDDPNKVMEEQNQDPWPFNLHRYE